MSNEAHQALTAPMAERVDYLMVLASLAGSDVVLRPAETAALRDLAARLALSDADTARVLEASQRPSHLVARHVESLAGSELRFALLSDCVAMALSDGEYAAGERTEIATLADRLGVSREQLRALEEAAEALRAADLAAHPEQERARRVRDVESRLAAVGVPLGMTGIASMVGLSLSGAATGTGAVVLGLGFATGLGAAVGAGLGTVMGLRWLMGKLGSKD